jgi:ABC-2 type transport system ATP-binding protein
MTNAIFKTYNLSKAFGKVLAVNEVNLEVNAGEVYGFLGPNGAGKTTTIGMALGLIHPSDGWVELFGQPVSPAHARPLRRVGSLVGRPALLPYLSGRGNLDLLAQLRTGVDGRRIAEVLERVGLTFAAERKAKTYSTGMKQRLGLAAAILHWPELIILDEPTNGLDPSGMRDVRNLISSLAEDGTTVFLSSHLLHEVEMVCDKIAVINKGQIVAQGSVDDLLAQQDHIVKVRVSAPEKARQILQMLPGVTQIKANGAYVEVKGVPSERIVIELVNQGIVPGEVTVQKNDLESLFLGLTQP